MGKTDETEDFGRFMDGLGVDRFVIDVPPGTRTLVVGHGLVTVCVFLRLDERPVKACFQHPLDWLAGWGIPHAGPPFSYVAVVDECPAAWVAGRCHPGGKITVSGVTPEPPPTISMMTRVHDGQE